MTDYTVRIVYAISIMEGCAMQYNKEHVGIHILAFLVARCQLFFMYPFVVPFFMAAYLQERSGIGVFIALMLGVCTKAGYEQAIRYGIVIVFLLILLKSTENKNYFENNIQIAVASGMVLWAISMPYQYFVTKKDSSIVFAFLEGIIVVCAVLIVEQGIGSLRAGRARRFSTNERFVGLLVLIAVALFGCPGVNEPFQLLFCLCSYLVLYDTYCYESSVGIAMGSVTGLVLAFQTGHISYLAIMIILSCVITLLKPLGKIGNLMAYLSGVILLGILYEKTLKQPYMLISALIAAALFCLYPRKQNAYRNNTLPDVPSEELLVQKVVETRVHDFGQAFLAMEKMLEQHEGERQMVNTDGLSNIYLSGDGISLLNAVESQSNRLLEMRKNFIRQLGQVGQAIASFPEGMTKQSVTIESFENKVRTRLERMGVIVVKAMLFQDTNEKTQVYMECMVNDENIVTGKMLAQRVGKMIGTKLVCVGKGEEVLLKEPDLFHFVEDGKYMLTTGIRRRGREGEMQCGDNFSIIKLDTQRAVLMLSDGMGSGESAYVKSEQIVDLLEQLLMAGFCREIAIGLLNSFISFVTDGNVSSTLDLMMLDLYTGTADFVKLGASTTFIKRQNQVEYIRSTSLPVGVLEQVEFDTCKRLLYHGDMVVMVSDGILDSIIFENKEEYLADFIARMDSSNAQLMADAIMEDVASMQRNGLRDDSTVLVAGIWEK